MSKIGDADIERRENEGPEDPQKDEFVFDPKAHAYFLNGRVMLGCTSVLGVIAKPALVPWAAKMATEYIKANAPQPSHGQYEVDDDLLEKAKNAHRKKKEDAAEKGTDLHALVEEYVQYLLKEYDGGSSGLTHDDPDWKFNPIKPFIEWSQREDIRFIATEQRLYSKELWVAGTCDLIFEKNGKRYIGDIKTYKKYWDRVPLIQCAGYSIMWEEMNSGWERGTHDFDPKIDGYCVICLPKERAFNEAEDVLWSFDPEADKKAFISAVNLYKYLNQKV